VAVGHTYSLLAFLPESESASSPPWAVFLDARRVATDQNAAQMAQEQIAPWVETQERAEHPVPARPTPVAADSRYSTPPFVYPLVQRGLSVVVWMRHNRVFFRPPPEAEGPARGHPRWYGERFVLSDPTTGPPPDEEETTRQGKTRVIHLQAWQGMRMRGHRQWPMHRCPCTPIRVWVTTPEGEMVYPQPLWLALFGPGQEEWPLREVVRAYFQRSHQEHGHRFLKRNLLATAYRTPEVRNEERWWRIVLVAAFQIWLGRELAQMRPRPWERYLHRRREGGESVKEVPPSHVQRDMERILRALGTPARRLQPRGKPVGRREGDTPDAPGPAGNYLQKGLSGLPGGLPAQLRYFEMCGVGPSLPPG